MALNYTINIDIHEDLLTKMGYISSDDLDLPLRVVPCSKYAYDSSNLINTDTINETISKDLYYLKNQHSAVAINKVYLNPTSGRIVYVIY